MRGFRNSVFKYLVLIGATALIVVAFGYRFVVGRPTTASASEVQIPSVTIKAVEYSFDAPDTIQAGLSAFIFENGGEQDHNLKVWRLKAGTSLDDIRSAQKLKDIRALVEPYGGAGPILHRETQQVILNFVGGKDILANTTLH